MEKKLEKKSAHPHEQIPVQYIRMDQCPPMFNQHSGYRNRSQVIQNSGRTNRADHEFSDVLSAFPSDNIYKPNKQNHENVNRPSDDKFRKQARNKAQSNVHAYNEYIKTNVNQQVQVPSRGNRAQSDNSLLGDINSEYAKSTSDTDCSNNFTNKHDNDYNGRYNFRKKPRYPQKFDSSKVHWADYKIHFEKAAKYNGWSMEEKADQLILSFDGESLKLLSQFSEQVQNNYDQLVDALNTQFDPVERAAAYKIEFRSRARRRNEAIMEFSADLRHMVTRAYPNQTSSAQELFLIDQFIMGLGGLQLKRHVQFGHPKTLHEAISLAIEAEAFDTAHGGDNFRRPKAEVSLVQPAEDDDDDDDDDAGAGAVACTILPGSSGKFKKNKYDNDITCRYCKKPGHTIGSCYKLQNKKAAEAENVSSSEDSPQLN